MKSKTNHLKTFLPLILWLIIIFLFSAQSGADSGGLSFGIVAAIGRWFRLEGADLKQFESILRTMAHFGLYFILGILMYREVVYSKIRDKNIRDGLGRYSDLKVTIVLCLLYAVSDEIHQYFVPERAMQVFDVMVDTLGATLGSYLWHRLEIFKGSYHRLSD